MIAQTFCGLQEITITATELQFKLIEQSPSSKKVHKKC